jgi:hypothetical protein
MEKVPVSIGPTEAIESDRARNFKKGTIEQILRGMESGTRKTYNVGDIVTTAEGLYAHQGLMVVEKREDGIVRVAPAPNTPMVEIEAIRLYAY